MTMAMATMARAMAGYSYDYEKHKVWKTHSCRGLKIQVKSKYVPCLERSSTLDSICLDKEIKFNQTK